uniref:Uncharacterized protein n=1 Tax=Daphnia galeata TaxID=27404 RepID=A0A8J2WNA1_9CRUS|nr:unnamed protein product [Daphnia galeata]
MSAFNMALLLQDAFSVLLIWEFHIGTITWSSQPVTEMMYVKP